MVCESVAGEPALPGSGSNLPKSISKERLDSLRYELDEGDNHWPDRMAAMIDEDYRQLMKDFGLR
jgi:hypothetical protein